MTGSSFAGSSQAANRDTICFPEQVVRERLTQARLYKYTDSLLKISEAQLSELKAQVSLLTEKEQELRNYFNREISNLENQVALYKDQVVGYEKIVRREKRKRFFSNLLGGLATAGAVYLAVTK